MRYRVDLERALTIEAGSVEEARGEALQALSESPDLLRAYEDRRSRGGTVRGASRLAAERERQVAAEGWTADHDRTEHQSGELVHAAISYALHPFSDERHGPDFRIPAGEKVPRFWPWDAEWWKPTPRDRIRELVKAGALIAAEIDRRSRAAHSQEPPS